MKSISCQCLYPPCCTAPERQRIDYGTFKCTCFDLSPYHIFTTHLSRPKELICELMLELSCNRAHLFISNKLDRIVQGQVFFFSQFHENDIFIIIKYISFRLQAVRANSKEDVFLHPRSFYHSLSLWVIRMHPGCLSAFSLITQRETGTNTKYTVCPHLSTPHTKCYYSRKPNRIINDS